ncbi:expressed unknown protein [Seminavis robusta]|uniref:Uncharacterized protein n=1 Tax=Seminavis robusta TaxID=568900 RepID=A0A9N8H319_9STRA|nr:expressed unknown protein [Seminavis robusta]|eukprot:Sro18_g013160.1 n/a (415) ;mRNA; r:167736-168980
MPATIMMQENNERARPGSIIPKSSSFTVDDGSSNSHEDVTELSLEDFADFAAPPDSEESGNGHLHNTISALQIAEEAHKFHCTRLTAPSAVNETQVAQDRRMRLRSMKMTHQQESLQSLNNNSFSNLGGNESNSSSNIDLEATSTHSQNSAGGSLRGLFKRAASTSPKPRRGGSASPKPQRSSPPAGHTAKDTSPTRRVGRMPRRPYSEVWRKKDMEYLLMVDDDSEIEQPPAGLPKPAKRASRARSDEGRQQKALKNPVALRRSATGDAGTIRHRGVRRSLSDKEPNRSQRGVRTATAAPPHLRRQSSARALPDGGASAHLRRQSSARNLSDGGVTDAPVRLKRQSSGRALPDGGAAAAPVRVRRQSYGRVLPDGGVTTAPVHLRRQSSSRALPRRSRSGSNPARRTTSVAAY